MRGSQDFPKQLINLQLVFVETIATVGGPKRGKGGNPCENPTVRFQPKRAKKRVDAEARNSGCLPNQAWDCHKQDLDPPWLGNVFKTTPKWAPSKKGQPHLEAAFCQAKVGGTMPL